MKLLFKDAVKSKSLDSGHMRNYEDEEKHMPKEIHQEERYKRKRSNLLRS